MSHSKARVVAHVVPSSDSAADHRPTASSTMMELHAVPEPSTAPSTVHSARNGAVRGTRPMTTIAAQFTTAPRRKIGRRPMLSERVPWMGFVTNWG